MCDYFELNLSRYLPVRFIFIYDTIRDVTLNLEEKLPSFKNCTKRFVSDIEICHGNNS